jgi:hypothetical protein
VIKEYDYGMADDNASGKEFKMCHCHDNLAFAPGGRKRKRQKMKKGVHPVQVQQL